MQQNAKNLSGRTRPLTGNLLLDSLPDADRALLEPHLEPGEVRRGDILFHAGQSIESVTFPRSSAVATLTIAMRDGRTAKSATIGREGAVGGVVSQGQLPAFSQAVVLIGGPIARIDAAVLQAVKQQSLALRNLLTRYSDCLVAQVLQSVACNALHSIEKRSARWLLTLQDRIGVDVLPITQDMLADTLGVQRTYVTRILRQVQQQGLVEVGRGQLRVRDRAGLERSSCECYAHVKAHFATVLGRVEHRADAEGGPIKAHPAGTAARGRRVTEDG